MTFTREQLMERIEQDLNPDWVQMHPLLDSSAGMKIIRQMPSAHLCLGEATSTPPSLEHAASWFEPLMDEAVFRLIVGAINHRFWSKEAHGLVRYTHQGQVGALAMTHACRVSWMNPQSPMRRVYQEHLPLTLTDIEQVFGPIPEPESRHMILNEVLLGPAEDTVRRLLKQAYQGLILGVPEADLLAQTFPLGRPRSLTQKSTVGHHHSGAVGQRTRFQFHPGRHGLCRLSNSQCASFLGMFDLSPQFS